MTRSRLANQLIFIAIITLVIGGCVAYILQPLVQRELACRRLFSDDACVRLKARTTLVDLCGDPDSPITTKIVGRIISELDHASVDAFFDAVSVVQEAGRWVPGVVPVELWCRRIEIMLDAIDPEVSIDSLIRQQTARQSIDWLSMLSADECRSETCVEELWYRLFDDTDFDETIRVEALRAVVNWIGNGSTPSPAEPYLAHAINDPSPEVQRLAWLMFAAVNPYHGYTIQYDEQTPGEVVTAMLWAATVTNPENAQPLIDALAHRSELADVLCSLLARSDDPAATDALKSFIEQNAEIQFTSIALAEKTGQFVPGLPSAIAGWLGLEIDQTRANHPLVGVDETTIMRWRAWRTGQFPNIDDQQALLDEPTAQDGSHWATVLLAERLLSSDAATQLALDWLKSENDETKEAGALLAGLIGSHEGELRTIKQHTQSIPVKRAARLGLLMIESAPLHSSQEEQDSINADRLIAWRMVSQSLTGPDLDVLLALLASGDDEALRVCVREGDGSPGDRLMRFAWLIERFAPDLYEYVEPISPWNDEIAALQLEAMDAKHAID